MPAFRHRSTVISAVLLSWPNWNEVCELLGPSQFAAGARGCYVDEEGKETPDASSNRIGLILPGVAAPAVQGDYIVHGVDGTFYAVKPAAFEASYDRFLENEPSTEWIGAELARYKVHLDNIRCDLADAGIPIPDPDDPELTPRAMVRAAISRFKMLPPAAEVIEADDDDDDGGGDVSIVPLLPGIRASLAGERGHAIVASLAEIAALPGAAGVPWYALASAFYALSQPHPSDDERTKARRRTLAEIHVAISFASENGPQPVVACAAWLLALPWFDAQDELAVAGDARHTAMARTAAREADELRLLIRKARRQSEPK